ncbi:MAG: sulfite exporter TauE/SafE family protein [Amaricoccus sp.]
MTSSSLLVAGAATFFVAGLVKGVTGMGLPTVAMGLLGALIPPPAAAGLLLVPSLVTNVWQLASGPALGSLVRRLWPMMLAIGAATVPGAALLASGDTRATTAALGIVLAAYGGLTLLGRQLRIPTRAEPWLSPLIGAATGVVTGATGVFVLPAVPYLQALGFGRDDLVQALGLSFTVSTIAIALGLGAHGAIAGADIGLSILALAPALAGMWAGQALRDRISPAAFRRVFLIGLLLLGTEMALRSLLG